ncbi:diacylglycerol O-acyltransferas-like protein 2B [Aureobasidium namibiae CBS 147.97]|uniref:diacylglycerol O-acyltransferase n=1 Tax=Aureobasidium namibiae CBS 147.97 TaxID=1043004 RepID=A0A074XTA2_9PEZI|nr:diacylglycerol O-acyltransferase-like protein 2B [Aureobasidium namibiae CBS 147.97]KEQ77806.1 diacylglycerol O-acyltransferas-like protein 2B [Aureobasidium namibiae CBS 147.97]
MSLNAEPADPQERQEHHLPPKSFADAAHEALDQNGHDSINEESIKETPPTRKLSRKGSIEPRPLQEMLDEEEKQPSLPSTPIQPRRTRSTKQQEKSWADMAEDGRSESPKSPAQLHRPHKRTSSLRSNKSNSPMMTVSEGFNGMQQKLVYEKFESPDGKQLTSVKPDDSYEEALRIDEKEAPKKKEQPKASKDELVSGRRAGAGWETSAIRWAPLNVPLQRRLQTAMVLVHTLSIAMFLAAFFILCAIPVLWPLLLPYLLYVLFSKAGTSGSLKYRSEWLRRLPVWSLFASYFPARLHRSQELPATRKYVFGYHPHGIISHGAFVAFATEALGFAQLFPGITNTLLTLDSNFRIPLYRDYALRLGLASVSRESCENILSKGGPNGEGMGRAITIVVGGARESLDAQPNSLRLVLARRKGFVKLAIRTGADLVPVLAFGENELYEQFDPQAHPTIHKFQLLVKKALGFTIPLFHARGVFNYDVGMMPYRRPLNIVAGRPIMVRKQERPDSNYVDEIHAQYVDELKRIWDEWKDVFAKHRDGDLEIVE